MRQNEFTFAITEHIAILEIHPSGWRRELNMVSWNGQSPRYDIRDWDQTHERMSKGVVLTAKEMAAVKAAIAKAAAEAEAQGKKVGIIDFDGNIQVAAKMFFKELRGWDSQGVDLIIAAGVAEEGLGYAVMNRMKNAAAGNIISV